MPPQTDPPRGRTALPRAAADALADFPAAGRAYAEQRLVGPGDTASGGRARLDAIVDWLQAIAHADVLDAGIAEQSIWAVRRTSLRVDRFPQFGERLTIRTACSGYGAVWTERRTSIAGAAGGAVEAAAIWVSFDPQTLRPAPVKRFRELYGEAAGNRRVRARLRHPGPPTDAQRRPWPLRHADLDLAGHVNNAAYWQVLEEDLANGSPATPLNAEVEHHAPGQCETATLLTAGDRRWLLGADGIVRASFLLQTPS